MTVHIVENYSELDAYAPKYVPGLYSYTHYESLRGDWFQIHHSNRGKISAYIGDETKLMNFDSLDELVEFLTVDIEHEEAERNSK